MNHNRSYGTCYACGGELDSAHLCAECDHGHPRESNSEWESLVAMATDDRYSDAQIGIVFRRMFTADKGKST